MPGLPSINGSRLIRALERAGWVTVRVHGSHHVLAHPEFPSKRLVIPVHNRPLKRGTLADILEAAELSADQLRELM
jgi:predicted RNA binding protein YcfA (HicA-like mRNA interferase family)